LLSREEYFKQYFGTPKPSIKEKHLIDIYDEYVCKHTVFNRDNFDCQVVNCEFESPITIHHYKHKNNNGKWKPRNCITVCRAHQNKYHTGKDVLVFNASPALPPRIRGMTQAHDLYVQKQNCRLQSPKGYLTKQDRYNSKLIRKNNREEWGKVLTWQEIVILLAWLFGFTARRGS